MISRRSGCYFAISLVFASVVAASLQSALGWELGAATSCSSQHSEELNKLEKVYSIRGVRVFWTEQVPAAGQDHRLPSQSRADDNSNGIPDYIENIARQADAARQAFIHQGFPDPLKSPRYTAVRFIDINVLNMTYNGRAYDSAVYYPDAPGRGEECTLRIDVSAQLETRWIGPPDRSIQAEFTKHWFVVGHEVFHLFQYGLTQFKRAWINEPTAKWAEYSLRKRARFPDKVKGYRLPKTIGHFQANVIDTPTSTTANHFWSRLIELVGNGSIESELTANLLEETYTDGEPIFKDASWQGTSFILSIYQALYKEEYMLSTINRSAAISWSERHQTSSEHDTRLLTAIQQVIRDKNLGGAEIEAFLRIQDDE